MFYRLKQFILFIGDLIMLYAGIFLGVTLRHMAQPGENFFVLLSPLTPLFGLAIIILFIAGIYDITKTRNSISFFQKILLSSLIWLLLSAFFFYTNPQTNVTPKTTLLLITISSFSLLAFWRYLYNKYLSSSFLKIPVIFVGWNDEVRELVEVILKYPEHGYTVMGIIEKERNPFNIPFASSLNDLIKLNNEQNPGLIILSGSFEDKNILSELYQAIFKKTTIIPMAEFYENIFGRIPPFTYSESWFITNLKEHSRKVYDRLRTVFDLLLAILMGLFFILSFPFIALAIKLTSRGPVLFKQKRTGKLGRNFNIYKYRTMKVLNSEGSAEISGPEFARVKDTRITGIGMFLRRIRLDELPQFINIIKGEMAVIGPRPERPEFVEELSKVMPFYNLRHLVKPGLAGWAQLQRSYYGTLDENLIKLQYDLYYIKNRNLLLDIYILLKTINIIIGFKGR